VNAATTHGSESAAMRRYPETPERRAERIKALADEAAKALWLTPGQHRTLFGGPIR
jgi:hypothetical protein